MKEVQVPGVLNRNSKIRDEHLRRNYGKYFQYTENLTPAIGEVYNIDYNRSLYSITDNQPLLEYTHNGNQKYGDSINRKYFNKNREKDIYSVKELNFDQIQAWGGDYTDYISYLDEVLGEDIYSRHVRYINDFLSGQYMENALRQTEVGVVRNINVPVAKQGIITTNPNNLKGLDTPLGTITNFMYSTLLYNGAIFNSDRKSEDKYITRSLINQYGNNLSNVTKLGDMLRVGVGDYELRDDLGVDAHIIHSFKDAVGDLNIHWMTKNIENAKKYLAEHNIGFSGYELGKEGYVNYIEGKESVLDLTDFISQSNFHSLYKSNTNKTYDIYNENDNVTYTYESTPSNEDDASWEHYEAVDFNNNKKSILSKTAQLFNYHKINTLIGRFHTSKEYNGEGDAKQEFIDTAKSKYGNSHGRNLLTRKAQDSKATDADDTNGYDNPYCRTWTFHHQYNQVKKLIRPFITVDDNGEANAMSIEAVQMANVKYRSRDDKSRELIGPKYLGDNTVLNKNGFVNICPSEGDISAGKSGVSIDKCMFSIENLAWKDVPKFTKENYISKEQTGPNGGRIMWFPPYDLSFSENVNVAWNESTFIGRGEKVYTYTNTDRTGTLSFTLLIDHPSIVNSFARLNDGDLSSDIDSDILRYFAGCEIPEIKDSDNDDNKNKKDTDKGEEEIKRHEKFSFYVYFPNNFSGVVSDKSGNKIKKYDSDWWKYILVGNNCELFRSNDALGSDNNAWVGYEITKGEGISKHYNIETIDKELEKDWIGVSQCHWDRRDDCIGDISSLHSNDAVDKNGNEVVDRTNGNWCFKYKVDNDLRQKLGAYLTEPNPTNVSFIDQESNQLNSKLNNKEFQKGADYTFGEVIAALLTAKKLNTKNSNNSMDNLSNIEADALLEFLLKNGCSTNSVKNLSKDFVADGLKIDSIKIFGSADGNDKKNSAMLAMRRAESIKRLFTEDVYDIKIDNEKIESSSQSSQSDPYKSANDKENKLQRYAFVTVEYSLPGTQALSSMSESATNKPEMGYEEDMLDKEAFTKWYDKLKENASIINEYDKIFDNEDFELEYNNFDDKIKEWCKENEIDYTDDTYWEGASDDDWNSKVVQPLVEKYGYNYLMPALCIGGGVSTDLNCEFLEYLNSGGTWVPSEFQNEYNSKKQAARTDVIETQKEKDLVESSIESLENEKLSKEEEKARKEDELEGVEISISDIEESIERLENRIDAINFELSHLSIEEEYKKPILIKERSEIQKDIDGKNSMINTLTIEIKEKLESEIDGLDDKIKELDKKIKQEQLKLDNANNKNSEAVKKYNKINRETPTSIDLTKTEIYFEELFERDQKFGVNNFCGQNVNCMSDIYTIRETAITVSWENFPYTKYHGVELNPCTESCEINLSYNLLLLEYLTVRQLIDNIDNGFEYGCDYLFKNDGDYNRLKNLLFINYLLKIIDFSSSIELSIEIIGFIDEFIFSDNNKYITDDYTTTMVNKMFHDYLDWMYGGQTQEELDEVISDVNSLILDTQTKSKEIINEVLKAANDEYNETKNTAEKMAKDKESQKLKKKYQSECATLDKFKESVNQKKDQYLYSIFTGSGVTRYETESEYFEKLDIEHPLIFKSIKEKFKYFNPAFHSMSPEGFNARLNFLHQCTRQGHTYEAKSGNGVKTAHNLAFGRMPVCVLRIGDFINTRIIINNVNINYDNGGIQWDLNPEGIGVQPMYAKVNLGITIIGGQSLNGPISRLQNAVSFDYYANTGVYDNRADRAHRDTTVGGSGDMTYDYVFNIKPSEGESDYTLYRGPKDNNNNNDYIDKSKINKAEYDKARKDLDGYKLSQGNTECKK